MSSLGNVTPTRSWAHAMGIISDAIKAMKKPGQDIQILEAGCGNKWDLDIGQGGHVLTGIDMDAEALRIRLEVLKDLDHTLVGDLRAADFETQGFDVIYNSYVLEHVPGADQVLENFTRWLKPGGLLVITIPDPQSVYGFTARTTPHWFHVFYYRYIVGMPGAGTPGYAPYPVVYDPIVSRRGIREYCRRNGYALIAEYGTGCYPGAKLSPKGRLVEFYKKVMAVLSLGYLSADHNDLLYLIRKPV